MPKITHPAAGTSACLGGCSASSQVWELCKGGAWACFGEGLTNQLMYLVGWVGSAPCGCVSACSELTLASASQCPVPLPACEQREPVSTIRVRNHCAEQASAEPSPGAALCLCQGRCSQRQGQPGSWQPVVTQRCPLGKGTQQELVGLSSCFLPVEPAFPSSRQMLTELGIYFISLQHFIGSEDK